jgi:hypothetical protein
MSDINQIIVGSILGDGSLYSLTKRNKYSTLDISQHVSKLPYLRWLYEKLEQKFILNPIFQKKGCENQYRFRSKPNKILGIFRDKFYEHSNGRKIIPTDIKDLLNNPISLAVWYMDDGNLDKRYKYHLNSSIATNCFSFEECNLLSEVLNDNFGLKTSVNKTTMRGKVYPRIYFKSECMDNFIKIIKPYIHPVFNYKIGIN